MIPYYDDGTVTIYHGDAREILPTLEPAVVVTDPPYGIGWTIGAGTSQMGCGQGHDGIVGDEDTSARDDVLAMASCPQIVFGSFYAPHPANVAQVLVWRKPMGAGVVGSVTGWKRDAEPVFLCGKWPVRDAAWSSVLEPGAPNNKVLALTAEHPHRKPVGLMRELLTRCPPGLVADPFMGSGSTLRAAKDLGRKAIGIEIEERYCEMAARRMGQEVMNFGEAA